MATKVASQPGNAAAAKQTSFEVYKEQETTPEILLTIQMVLAARRWRSLLDDKLRPIEQSSARMEALAAIMASPPLSPQVDIARRLKIEGPTLTRMLDSLEKDGLVERLPDPTDRRTKQLRLTPTGEAALEEIFGIADTMRARLLAGLDEDQIDQLNSIFGNILDRLEQGLPE
jgi:MarR family transcriptional regulator for hemolysin